MQDERIRLSSTDSVNSVDKDNFVDVEFSQHTKVFPFPNISDTIDQREVFESERENSKKYRLIVTINPYCTNVLFNAVTEIVQNEGTDVLDDLVIVDNKGIKPDVGDDYVIQGKNENVTNTDMVRNTEYSNGKTPFVYHCGYDIFNNHILRNQSFKLVNPIGSSLRDTYNTIRDMMRYSDGQEVPLYRRTDINNIDIDKNTGKPYKNKHLYLKDDILTVTDSINANLSENNGWYGFYNRSSIPSCKRDSDTSKDWKDMKISKVFNTEDTPACGFIEMYPDSSLYSFNPKYNSFQNREEQNWDICLTYPYKHILTKDDGNNLQLVYDGDINGLLLASYKQTYGTSGQEIILFRSYVKHNLNVDDKFKLYYIENGGSEFKEIKDVVFSVTNVGDLDSNNIEYYFYTNNIQDIRDIFGLKENDKLEENKYTFRFVKIVNDMECKYYYRKFRKLPNFRYKKEELTEEVARNEEEFKEYLKKNCQKDEKTLLFNKEQYQLAFAQTNYGDTASQITFTDTIDLSKLVDNLGRPLTEIYLTIIKRNKGYKEWYDNDKNLEDIEYSHCFGELTSGIEMHIEKDDRLDSIIKKRRLLNDVSTLSKDGVYSGEVGETLDNDITLEDTEEFYGDVVELDTSNMRETVLSDVCFRFNTLQRETDFTTTNLNCGVFSFDEIETDDYDRDGFVCETYKADDINGNGKTTFRREGYYYKAHYPIKVRAFGRIEESSDIDIDVISCNPRQAGGLFIEVVSRLRSGVTSGSVVYVCNKQKPEEKYRLLVNSVLSNVRFLLNPMDKNDNDTYKSVFELVEMLNDTEHWQLRLKNIDIPSYAYEVKDNMFLWRNVLSVGNKDAIDLTEYPFANGHFYIHKDINFYLKRQDPFGWNGLQASDVWPNDPYGNVKKPSNYTYKDETNVIC